MKNVNTWPAFIAKGLFNVTVVVAPWTTASTNKWSFIPTTGVVGPVMYIPLCIATFNVNTKVTDVAALSTDVDVVDSVILTLPSNKLTSLATTGIPVLYESV